MAFRSLVALMSVLALGACRQPVETDAGPRPGVDAGPPRDAGDCTPTGSEDSPGACGDGVDNDCSGFIDCNDFSCCSHVTCGAGTACGNDTDAGSCTPTVGAGMENTMELCTNGLDDDCNGFADCREFDCGGFCPAENSTRTCTDGVDNDGDPFVDCEDNDCENRVVCAGEVTNAACSDGMDNDGNDGIDCADPDCQAEGIVVCDGTTPVTIAPGDIAAAVAVVCHDEMDNDSSEGGNYDCGDFSCLWNDLTCQQPAREQSNAACSDGEDNDFDGEVDCDDTSCRQEGIAVCRLTNPGPDVAPAAQIWEEVVVDPGDYETASNALCTDSMNNDQRMGNTFMDCADFGCNRVPDVTACTTGETNDANCSDGDDNDGDGRIDCADFDCSQNPTVTVCESSWAQCTDAMDNDGNGFVDCDDFSCRGGPACTGDDPAP